MKRFFVIIIFLLLPTFGLMLRPGLYTMHDFHAFRLLEFHKCITDHIFPCRWAPDAENGFGEPLFNFYGQFPYWIGELFVLGGLGIIGSLKITFILTFIVSGLVMYWVCLRYSNPRFSLLASMLYIYAPYRSVDIWVRGALNESFAFALYPLIFYCLDRAITDSKLKYYLGFAISISLLIITHNLSFLMFSFILAFWTIYRLITTRNWQSIIGLGLSSVLAILLAAFYLLPVAVETHLVAVQSATTQGYYNYQLHYTTLKQLFLSRFWGYGASVWSDGDGLSFSFGQIQAILLGGALLISLIKKNFQAFMVSALGVVCIFMTHGKSEIIWKAISPLSYVQFPWRFLAPASFFASLGIAWSASSLKISKLLLATLVVVTVLSNVGYFRPDIWQPVADADFFSGNSLRNQMQAHKDFWPVSAGHPPADFAPTTPIFTDGSGKIDLGQKNSNSQTYVIDVTSPHALISFPTVYFPGWTSLIDGVQQPVKPSSYTGLIAIDLPMGSHKVELRFIDTWPRLLGNVMSLITLLGLVSYTLLRHEKK